MSLSKYLRKFADGLAPNQDMLDKAGQATDMIQRVLQDTHGLSVARVVPLGSYAKKTSLGLKMDVDLHVFLNDEMPPFTSAKRKMVQTLRRSYSNVQEGSHAFKLKVNGVDVDVIPTVNMVNKYVREGNTVAENQLANVLYYLKHIAGPNVDKKRDFSTSVSECAVAFEKKHSAFSHAMSRLAKYWGNQHPFNLKGKSSIMEYLGARAAENEESHGSQDLLNAFRRFLNMVEQPQSICVYWDDFYSIADIPQKIIKQRPLLLDPSNPHDNFFKGVSHDQYHLLSHSAKRTLTELNEAERNGSVPAMFKVDGASRSENITIFWPKSI
ncbi:2'-5'-oligoadenylate synthase 2-like [Apostichopus japonicus]|uniref:2'-5'-oligoadenylate synthase 2-like n=1 Tax=Stichopus japonicus TaxID=307972 RepID=UPI003AB729C5